MCYITPSPGRGKGLVFNARTPISSVSSRAWILVHVLFYGVDADRAATCAYCMAAAVVTLTMRLLHPGAEERDKAAEDYGYNQQYCCGQRVHQG